MHVEALDFCYRAALLTWPDTVVEFGSRNVNGTAREAFPGTRWVGIDIEDGHGVDLVGDPSELDPTRGYDLGICTEVLEHSGVELFGTLVDWVAPGGWVLVTCATYGRAPHSAVDGGPLRAGEFYENVDPDALDHPLLTVMLQEVHADRGDLYLLARRRDGGF